MYFNSGLELTSCEDISTILLDVKVIDTTSTTVTTDARITILVLEALYSFSSEGTCLVLYAFNNQTTLANNHQHKAMADD
jgi:hypothetical protein